MSDLNGLEEKSIFNEVNEDCIQWSEYGWSDSSDVYETESRILNWTAWLSLYLDGQKKYRYSHHDIGYQKARGK